MSTRKKEKEAVEAPVERSFIYVKPYVQEKVVKVDGNKVEESTPKLDEPRFRNSYKADEVTFDKNKINGMVASVDFRQNYNKDGFDIGVLMVTNEHYCVVQVSLQSVMGQQLAKRLMNIDYTKKVVLEVWKNKKGYANLSVYQRDLNVTNENGINPKEYVVDYFKDEGLPDIREVKIRGKVERDNSERVEFIKSAVEDWKKSEDDAALQLVENASLVTLSGSADDDGNDDV